MFVTVTSLNMTVTRWHVWLKSQLRAKPQPMTQSVVIPRLPGESFHCSPWRPMDYRLSLWWQIHEYETPNTRLHFDNTPRWWKQISIHPCIGRHLWRNLHASKAIIGWEWSRAQRVHACRFQNGGHCCHVQFVYLNWQYSQIPYKITSKSRRILKHNFVTKFFKDKNCQFYLRYRSMA